MKNIFCYIILLTVTVIGVPEALWAQTSDLRVGASLSTVYLASSQWVSGTVEAIETEGKYKYVRINGIQYRLMPQVAIARKVPRGGGAYDEVPASFHEVRQHRGVVLRVQGFRIYQILIME